MCACTHAKFRCSQRPEEKELDSPVAKVAGVCTSQDVGAGDQTWVLLKSSECS